MARHLKCRARAKSIVVAPLISVANEARNTAGSVKSLLIMKLLEASIRCGLVVLSDPPAFFFAIATVLLARARQLRWRVSLLRLGQKSLNDF